MNVGKRIKQRRKQLGLSAEQLAEMIGKSPATVYRYESGDIENVNSALLLPIADALMTTPSALMGWEDTDAASAAHTLPTALKPISQMHHQRVPLIGKVAAGAPIMAETDYDAYVDTPVKCDSALEVSGDSMAPTYLPGDILYIRCQPDVSDGGVAVVLIDDAAAVKHVYHDPDGLTLISDNPAYPPIRVRASEHDFVAIYGIPVGYTRMYRADPLMGIHKGFKP